MEKPKLTFIQKIGELANKDIVIDHGQLELVEESPAERKKHGWRYHLSWLGLPALLLLILVWMVGGTYFQKMQLGDSTVSLHQSDAALQRLIDSHVAAYKLTIAYPNKQKKDFTLSDSGLHIDTVASLKNIRRQQNHLASRLQWWRPAPVFLVVNTNTNKINSFITQQATITVQPAQDATLSIEHGKVQVKNSTTGSHYGLDDPVNTLVATATTLRTAPLSLQSFSTRPAISPAQLAASQSKLQKILAQTVSFTIDNKTIQASSEDIADWIELTAKDGGRSVDVTVNSGKVLDYINKIIADSVHLPKSQIEVLQNDGTRKILVPGVNGTDVVNKADVATKVTDSLLRGEGLQQSLTVQYAGFKTITAQTYDKWIEVDLTNKRMYAYTQSTLAKTFLITAGAPATPTVTGQFAIYAKYAQQDMRGQNVDGSSYFQPKVPWVNYFYADYAIHGNYWRPLSYFGNINSSHGCVGIVESDAQWMYTWAPIGTPVIVHT